MIDFVLLAKSLHFWYFFVCVVNKNQDEFVYFLKMLLNYSICTKLTYVYSAGLTEHEKEYPIKKIKARKFG